MGRGGRALPAGRDAPQIGEVVASTRSSANSHKAPDRRLASHNIINLDAFETRTGARSR